LPHDKYIEKLEKQKTPENVNIDIKKCNPEIWKYLLTARQKSQDLKIQKIQQAMTKTMSCLIRTAADMMDFVEEHKDAKTIPKVEVAKTLSSSMKKNMDAAAIMSGAYNFTNGLRREQMINSCHCLKPLNMEAQPPDGDLLFGEDVIKRLAENKSSLAKFIKNKHWKNDSGYRRPETKNFNRSYKNPKERTSGYVCM